MHPSEAHGAADRSDAAKYECHCFEVLYAEKMRHSKRLESVEWLVLSVRACLLPCQLGFVKKYDAFAARIGCTTEPNRF
jgi:hypothetical protein